MEFAGGGTRRRMRPGAMLFWFVAVSAAVWTAQCALCQNVLPLDVIETIVWGAQWQLGQMKSPPLSGWIGYLVSCASGHRDWSMYLLAQLCLACGVGYTYRLAREFFDEAGAAAAALLLYCLHYYTPSSMKFCSHFLETAFLPAVSFYFYRAVRDDRWRDWIGTAVFAALAFLGKYAAVQLFIACFLWMLWGKEHRRRFRSPKPYLTAALFLILVGPHLWWLCQHDFLPVRHMEVRMEQEVPPWYEPILAVITWLYPLAAGAAALVLARMPWRRGTERVPIQREALRYALLLALVTGGFYVAIVFCRENIVMMWFSYLASWSGIAVVAASPWKVDEKVFRRLMLLIVLFTVGVFIGTTIDTLTRPVLKCHLEPRLLVEQVERYAAEHAPEGIPVVVGHRWAAGVVENYSASRPPTCWDEDPFEMRRREPLIRQRGALLLSYAGKKAEDKPLRHFFAMMGREVPLETFELPYRTRFGKTKIKKFVIGWFPPDEPATPEKAEK